MQYETMLKNMIPVVKESYPLIGAAYAEKENFNLPAGKGSAVTINRPNPNSFTVAAITPAAYGSGEASITSDTETLTLGQPVGCNFAPTDHEVVKAAWEGVMSPTILMAARAMGKYIASALADVAVLAAYQQITKSADALYDLAAIRDKFALNGIDPTTATLCLPSLLEFESNANLLHQQIGGGSLGAYAMQTRLGRVAYDHSLAGKTFTNGTGASIVVAAAGAAKGAFTVTADGGSGTILAGDIITFASHTGNYLVTSAYSGGSMNIYPSLRAAVVNDCAISVVSTTATSLGIAVAPMGLAFVSRPLSIDPEVKGQTFFVTASDDQTGISLNYEVRREYHQTRKQLSCSFAVGKGFPDCVVKYKIA
jgi:hypothetical protein